MGKSFYCRQSARGSKIIKLKILSTVKRLFDSRHLFTKGWTGDTRPYMCIQPTTCVYTARAIEGGGRQAGLLMLPRIRIDRECIGSV